MPMENGERTVGVTMDSNLYLDIVKAILVWGYLQYEAIESYTVVIADSSLKLLTEDIVDG